MVSFCPTCGASYGDDVRFCVQDGTRLVPEDTADALLGKTVAGRFALAGVLGDGAMARIYRAQDLESGQDVALKLMHPKYARDGAIAMRFIREAWAIAGLRHEGIVGVVDSGRSPSGQLYMALDLVEGQTLDEVLNRDGEMPWRRAVGLARQIADALAEAHRHGIVHRDLTPSNILLVGGDDGDERVRLIDFGLAKVEQSGAVAGPTQTGTILGTPSYMSPEQVVRATGVDGRSDQYSLGTVLHQMLTGRVCFDGRTTVEVVIKHLNEPPPPLPAEVVVGAPPGLPQILAKMLEKKPGDRYPTCEALIADLDALLASDAGHAGTRPRLRRATPPPRRATPPSRILTPPATVIDKDPS